MNKKEEIKDREHLLYRYFCALERGDFDTVTSVLGLAEGDPQLERMILEVNHELIDEQAARVTDEEAELVRDLIRCKMPSALPEEQEPIELPPLTVGYVVSRLQHNSELWQQAGREDSSVIERLRRSDEPLPASLTRRGVGEFLEQIGIRTSERFQKLFRETAIFLSMGREQGMAQLAAARRQKAEKRKDRKEQR